MEDSSKTVRLRELCVGSKTNFALEYTIKAHFALNCTTETYFVQSTTFHLIPGRLWGGGSATVTVRLGGTIVFDGFSCDVIYLKKQLYKSLGIFVHRQILMNGLVPLPDSMSLTVSEECGKHASLNCSLLLMLT